MLSRCWRASIAGLAWQLRAYPGELATTVDQLTHIYYFVADRIGKVFKLTDEVPIAAVIERVKLGTPAGIALTLGEKALLARRLVEAGTTFVLVSGKWGYFEPNYSLDILKTKVPVERNASPVEQYTISTVEADGGINVVFEWSDVRFVVQVAE